RRHERNNECVLEAVGELHALVDEEGRHPAGEAVETDRLRRMKQQQHASARAIFAAPKLGEVSPDKIDRVRHRYIERPTMFARNAYFQSLHDSCRLFDAPMAREPPWTLRQSNRMIHTTIAPAAPIIMTRRQPSMPIAVCGTSSHASSATVG